MYCTYGIIITPIRGDITDLYYVAFDGLSVTSVKLHVHELELRSRSCRDSDHLGKRSKYRSDIIVQQRKFSITLDCILRSVYYYTERPRLHFLQHRSVVS